jgi:hypothetical protein
VIEWKAALVVWNSNLLSILIVAVVITVAVVALGKGHLSDAH